MKNLSKLLAATALVGAAAMTMGTVPASAQMHEHFTAGDRDAHGSFRDRDDRVRFRDRDDRFRFHDGARFRFGVGFYGYPYSYGYPYYGYTCDPYSPYYDPYYCAY